MRRREATGLGRRLKHLLRRLRYLRHLLRYHDAAPGTAPWLIATEIKYGGYHTGVARRKVSPDDPRSVERISKGGMTGGDRMLHHGYAPKYADHLKSFLGRGKDLTLVEVGILRGTGPAIWSDLFEGANIIGLDIDLSHTRENLNFLVSKGAFRHGLPTLHQFDQLEYNRANFQRILDGAKIDVFIDDGFHSDEAILRTLESAQPHLADAFVYFAEDNHTVHTAIRSAYPNWRIESAGRLTNVNSQSRG